MQLATGERHLHPARSGLSGRLWPRLGLLGLAALLLQACASTPPAAPPSSTAGEALLIDDARINALYERIGETTSTFQAGLELVRAGSPEGGEAAQNQALDGLDAAARECAETPGCESQRFFAAYRTLIRLQAFSAGMDSAERETADLAVSASEGEHEPVGASAAETRLPEIERGTRLLRGRDLRELIVLNEPVRAALDDWLTWMRPQLIESWINYQYLRADMAPAYAEAGLPEALLFAILAKESAGRVHAYSRAGAAGPLQFMPATGRRYGLGGDASFDERLDPAKATRANVAYINDQLRIFNDNLELTLAAYNGGENRMKRLAQRHPGRGFWSDPIFFALPTETRDYVPKVLAAAYLFLHPAEFNLEFPLIDNQIGSIELTRRASLGEIAICLGQTHLPSGWFRTLRNLNPRVSPEERLAVGARLRVPSKLVEVYADRCQDSALMQRVASLHDARHPQGPRTIRYVVRRGDTLAAIAKRSRCTSVRELAALNGIKPPKYALKVGQTLTLPTCS